MLQWNLTQQHNPWCKQTTKDATSTTPLRDSDVRNLNLRCFTSWPSYHMDHGPNSLRSWGKVINPTLSWTHWWKLQYKYVYLPYLHIIPIIMDIQQQLYKHISMVFDPHGPCKHVSPCIYCEHEKSPLTMRQTFDMTYHASAYGVGIGAMVSW